jgi:hypothetical protein
MVATEPGAISFCAGAMDALCASAGQHGMGWQEKHWGCYLPYTANLSKGMCLVEPWPAFTLAPGLNWIMRKPYPLD